jgi:hypothetical protein
MKLNKVFATLVPLFAVACLQGTVSDNITVDKQFSYTLPVSADTSVPAYTTTLTQSTQVDVSDVVSKLTSLGSLSFNVSSSTLTANMNMAFANHVEIDVIEADGSKLVVADADIVFSDASDTTFNLPVVADSNDLLNYLGSGPVSLSVSLTVSTSSGVIPSGSILDLEYTLGLNASESVSKSL